MVPGVKMLPASTHHHHGSGTHLAVTPLLSTWLHCLQPDVSLMLILEGDQLGGQLILQDLAPYVACWDDWRVAAGHVLQHSEP
jgi:hypothetical protein